MKQTVSNYDFHRAFEQIRPDNFSYQGLNVLYDYIMEYEDSTGEEMELDVIALCCDFTEETLEEIAENYDICPSDSDELADTVLEHLEICTSVAGATDSGSIVYMSF
jgi:hypothetical protein